MSGIGIWVEFLSRIFRIYRIRFWIELVVWGWTYAKGRWLRMGRFLAPEVPILGILCPAAGRRGLGIGLYTGAVCAELFGFWAMAWIQCEFES